MNKTKKIRLTRKQRQIRSIVILLVLVIVVFKNFPINIFAGSNFLDDYDQITITIIPGDRAWNIQQELTPDVDVRKALYYVNELNGKCTGNIIAGEDIIFLVPKVK